MSISDLPDPSDERVIRARRLPGRRNYTTGSERATDPAIYGASRVPDGAPRSIDDLPPAFRKPAKPPGKR